MHCLRARSVSYPRFTCDGFSASSACHPEFLDATHFSLCFERHPNHTIHSFDHACSTRQPHNYKHATMASAFRRGSGSLKTTKTSLSSPSLLGLRGVKPWAGGIHLTSVGLNDLDAILGGGQPLGTCILLQEDRWTRDLALSLVKYWCAEVCTLC
jgi:hypothetical protein